LPFYDDARVRFATLDPRTAFLGNQVHVSVGPRSPLRGTVPRENAVFVHKELDTGVKNP
jgi:hypothetical protein